MHTLYQAFHASTEHGLFSCMGVSLAALSVAWVYTLTGAIVLSNSGEKQVGCFKYPPTSQDHRLHSLRGVFKALGIHVDRYSSDQHNPLDHILLV
jgi:hypothetical protein